MWLLGSVGKVYAKNIGSLPVVKVSHILSTLPLEPNGSIAMESKN